MLLKINKKSRLKIEKLLKRKKIENKLYFWPKNKNNKKWLRLRKRKKTKKNKKQN